MCEDQGMAIVSWASLGGGVLTTKEQRQKMADDPDAPKGYGDNPFDVAVSEVIEDLARSKSATFQDIVSRLCHVAAPRHSLTLNRLWHTCFINLPTYSPSWEYKPSSTSRHYQAQSQSSCPRKKSTEFTMRHHSIHCFQTPSSMATSTTQNSPLQIISCITWLLGFKRHRSSP